MQNICSVVQNKDKQIIILEEVIKMGIIENMNQRVKKFSIFDVKLAQGASIFFILIIVKLIPQIMNLNIWWFVALLVICVIKPFYVFLLKK